VIEVIDRYLSELVPAQSAMQVACEVDLSQSGQAFVGVDASVIQSKHPGRVRTEGS